jgi:acetyl esterase
MSFLTNVQRRVSRSLTSLSPGTLRAVFGKEVRSPEGYVLDPQVQAIVRMSEVLGHSEWARLGVARARRAMDASSQILQPRPRGALSVHDEVIRVKGGAVRARVYKPAERSGDSALPVVVFYHGGGFVLGSLRSHDGECRAISLGVGALVIAVDYRLAPEHKFPTAVDDGVAAYLWAAENAASLGGDPQRMAVMGDSAGGNIAAVVARDLREHPRRPVFQLLVYPATDFTRSMPSHRHFEKGFFLTKASIDWFMANYLRGPEDRTHPRGSPLLTEDHVGLPPALVVTAGFDPLRDEGRAYADAMRASGVPVEHRCHEGLVHGFFSMTEGIDAARVALDDMIAALRAALLQS